MNPAHLHLMITHFPVLGSLSGLFLSIVALVRNSNELKRVSLWVFVLGGISAIPTYLTGRPAATVLVKLMPGMTMDAGDQHAEVAVLALVASSLLGIVALAGLFVYRKKTTLPGWFAGVVVALALITSAGMIWTASLGGRIRHTEIQAVNN